MNVNSREIFNRENLQEKNTLNLDFEMPIGTKHGIVREWRRVAVLLVVLALTVYLAAALLYQLYSLKSVAPPRNQHLARDNVLLPSRHTTTEDKVVSCYYNTPSNESTPLLPSDIHPFLCTHINVAFAQIVNKEIHLDAPQYRTLLDVVQLKHDNPNLKVLLSVGGSSNDGGFPDMVDNHASRKVFIKSIKKILKEYNLDGIDLDWEFPAMHDTLVRGKRERQHFSQLLREIRMEYIREKKNYLLTIAAAAPEIIVNVAYDVDQINLYVDYVNVMTYDFHFYTKYTPFTGFNSPLFARPEEHLYLASLNVNYTIHLYISKGLDLNKLVIGIPTYAHTFTLVNPNNPNVGSPAVGQGSVGAHGFASSMDVCAFRNQHKTDIVDKYDSAAKVPYLYRAQEWISYESSQSVTEKAMYIKELGLRGAMIYSLNTDDYEGSCNNTERFPLVHSIRSTLLASDATPRAAP